MGSRSRSAVSSSQAPSQEALEEQGIDPAFAAAILARNPLAVAAAAGILDNSLIAAALGLNRSGRDDTRVATTDRGDARSAETERGRDDVQDRVESRGTSEGQQPDEGSGEHGRLDPELADYANHAFWRSVAVAAEGMGHVNAARHMHHYLDNSGSQLDIDLDVLEASCPVFADNVQIARQAFIDDALDTLDGANTALAGAWDAPEQSFTGSQSYFTRSESTDWFFAIGGNTHVMTGTTTYTPDPDGSGKGTISFTARWSLIDRYNWDGGKSVNIMGVTVNDEVLGRLHVVGLAREYDIRGEREDTFSVRYTGQLPGDDTEVVEGGGRDSGDPRAGRDDADRERR